MNATWRFPPGADFAFMRCSSDRVLSYSYVDTTPLLRVIAAHCSRADKMDFNVYLPVMGNHFFFFFFLLYPVHISRSWRKIRFLRHLGSIAPPSPKGHWVICSVCEWGWATEEKKHPLICSYADENVLLASGVRGRNGQAWVETTERRQKLE